MNVLVLGGNGQLANEIRVASSFYNSGVFIFKNSKELDICDFHKLQKVVKQNNVSIIINCAAYTNVDAAENDWEKAYKINCLGVKNSLAALPQLKGKLIHFSTDYVFDGKSQIPYKVDDTVNPVTAYGKTKYFGELEILKSDVDSIIIRTSWLYSDKGNNFVNKIENYKCSKNSMFR